MAVVQISIHFTQELPVTLLGFRSLGSSRVLQGRKREGRCWYYCTRSPLKASGLCLRRKVKGNVSLFVYSIDSRCVRHSDFITMSEKLNLIRWYIDRQTAWKQMGEIWKKKEDISMRRGSGSEGVNIPIYQDTDIYAWKCHNETHYFVY